MTTARFWPLDGSFDNRKCHIYYFQLWPLYPASNRIGHCILIKFLSDASRVKIITDKVATRGIQNSVCSRHYWPCVSWRKEREGFAETISFGAKKVLQNSLCRQLCTCICQMFIVHSIGECPIANPCLVSWSTMIIKEIDSPKLTRLVHLLSFVSLFVKIFENIEVAKSAFAQLPIFRISFSKSIRNQGQS